LIRNKYEIQFFGLQRSGNHGVITWILQQFNRPQYFLNNVAHFKDPFEFYRNSEVPNMVPLARGRLEETRLKEKELLLYSYENLMLPRLAKYELVENAEQLVGVSEHCAQVVLIREFYNWIISRLKLFDVVGQEINVENTVDMLVDLWVVYAREYCGHSDFLRHNRVGVLFDRWVVDEHYRVSILDQLEIPLLDNSNGRVPRGGGSSFNEDQGRSKVSAKGVLNRWQNAAIDPEVREMIERKVASVEQFDSLYNEVMVGHDLPEVSGF
jgi:hypothetical protein